MRAFLALFLISCSALAAPQLGPEIPLDTPVVISAPVSGHPMEGASNGTVSLLAWFDTRSGSVNRVHAARLDAQGQVLDKPFLDLGAVPSSTSQLDVDFDGTNFVVAWVNQTSRQLVFRRVSAQGAVVDASEKVIRTVTTGSLAGPALSTNRAGNTLVTWLNVTSGGSLVEAARIDATGAVLDAAALNLGTAAGSTTYPAAAFDGAQHLVVFHTGASSSYSLSQRRVSTGGVVQGAAPTLVAALGNSVAQQGVACDGTNCLVAFSNLVAPAQLVGVRVANSGTVIDAAPLVLASAANASHTEPSVSFDGTQYWVVATHTPTAASFNELGAAVRVSTAGAPLGATAFGVSGNFRETGFVGPGKALYGLDWGAEQVTRIGTTGALLDPAPIVFAWAANRQRSGRVAFGAGQLLAAWVDDAEGRDVVLARRFSPAGAQLDTAPIRLAEATAGAALTVGDVAFDGQSFVVGWNGLPAVQVARISTSGARLDPLGGITVTTSARSGPRFAVDGTQTWMEWEQFPSSGGTEIAVARLSRTGMVLDSPPLSVISRASGSTFTEPRPCFDGTQVWASWVSGGIGVTRLSSAPAVLDPGGISIAGAQSAGATLGSGSPCVAAWVDTAGQVWLNRVSTDGGVDANGSVLTNSLRTRAGPSVVWNGGSWVVARGRDQPVSLEVARWSQGLSLDATPASADLPFVPVAVASASDLAGTSWVLTERFDAAPGLQSVRLSLRVVLDLPNGKVCMAGAECRTGNCVDGVCCNSACAGGTSDCQACSVAAGATTDGACGPTTGNTCSDSNACTMNDKCSAGSCGGAAVSCAAPTECQQSSVCAPATGACVVQNKPDGTACSAGHCTAGGCGTSGAGGGSAGGAGGGSAGGAGGGSAGGAAGGGSAGGTAGGSTVGGGGGQAMAGSCGCGTGGGLGSLLLTALGGLLQRRRGAGTPVRCHGRVS